MPKAVNPFEAKYKTFDRAASQEVVKRANILRSLTNLEKSGVEMTSEGNLDRDELINKMHFAVARAIDLNEQGVVEPPLAQSKVDELTTKRDLYEVMMPAEAEQALTPSQMDKIPTSDWK